MKIIYSLILIFLFLSPDLQAEKIDPNQKPDPLPETTFEFPKYTETRLKNGLKLFIIEDHEQPTITMRLLVPGGNSVEGEKSGLADMVASLLTKGAGKLSALELATKIDGVGASISASARGDYITVSGSGLIKHLPVILKVFADVVAKPTFTDDEFDKLVPQMIAAVQNEKSSPGTLAAAMARKIVYGEGHPYAKRASEKSVNSMKVEDCKNYYANWFKPNESTLAIIGDVNKNTIVKVIEKAFKSWKEGETPDINIPSPKPMPLGVYFVERPASVQSSIIYTTQTLPYADKKYNTIRTAASLIGGGFAGRLFKTLREKHSYTYSPFGYQTRLKYTNSFICGSDVRNEVTDSSIVVIKEQISNLVAQPPEEEELYRVKKYLVGTYQMSFEKSSFIAALVQNADFFGISMNKVKSFPQRIMKLTGYDMQDAAKQYLNPDKAYLVVVGSPDVKDKLGQFGKVYTYNLDLEPKKIEEVSMTAEELIEAHTKAVGGKEAINSVKTIMGKGQVLVSMQGQTMPPGKIIDIWKAPNMKYTNIDLGTLKQETWVDGKKAWASQNGIMNAITGKDLVNQLNESIMFFETKLIDLGYNCEVLGKQNGLISMKAKGKDGSEKTYFFDPETFLLAKVERVKESPRGNMPITITFEDYTMISNVMLPGTIKNVSPYFTLTSTLSYEINQPADDSQFNPKVKKQPTK